MGARKQKWTEAEESALKAGVEKYGPGKWKTILSDPVFALVLSARSNVDLKDKWRNLNPLNNVPGESRDRKRSKKSKTDSSPSPTSNSSSSSGSLQRSGVKYKGDCTVDWEVSSSQEAIVPVSLQPGGAEDQLFLDTELLEDEDAAYSSLFDRYLEEGIVVIC
eukprot:TRINITY_DN181_c0_g1_i1.p1 TRINITY_DN181_c0_g1~~TRINITY_DN181_c0_g1_i1.p1  ORF type:complete len:163 (-),score=31.68 TRINITY_DN181_c0_g1_i1:387-875(-)